MRGELARTRELVATAAVAAVLIAGGLLAPQPAQASIASVFGGDVSCSVRSDGVRYCGSDSPRSTTPTFDGTPLDVKVAFPPAPAARPDGDYPLMMLFHGYGGDTIRLPAMRRWLDRGYATFTMAARGFNESCGSAASRRAAPQGCAKGYIRLMDSRYEVRDAQELAGRLVDQGVVDPRRIGAAGRSYGGAMSVALAALKNRKVLQDGRLIPWTSPRGTPMRIAGAVPGVGWTDLAYSLIPNGGTLDYVADAPYRGRIGVVKTTQVENLYEVGLRAPGFYPPPGSDPDLDITGLQHRLAAGEPYGSDVQAAIDELTTNHSAYYVDHSTPPAPVLIATGFTDDLFPTDEALRFYNRTRTEHPDAEIGLFFGDFGHPRSQQKADTVALLQQREEAWLDHYVKGTGPEPAAAVTAMTQTCPKRAPSGGPFTAPSWARMTPGEVRLSGRSRQTIAADSTTNGAFDPQSGGGACARTSATDSSGAAVYRFGPAPEAGYTLLGSTTVVGDFKLRGKTSQVAARLLDVAPDGTQSLVARGLWRPANGRRAKRQAFQLHANGWHFAAGHVPKLELLATDSGRPPASYGRPSNDQRPVRVSDLQVRLPVRELPGSLGGLIKAPAPKFLPRGYDLAADVIALGDPRAKLAKGGLVVRGRKLEAKVECPARFAACTRGQLKVSAAKPSGGGKRATKLTVAKGRFTLVGGKRKTLRMQLNGKARRYLREHPQPSVKTQVTSSETRGAAKRKVKVRRGGPR